MEDRYRKKEPCTVYKREGRTKQNVYECLPSNLEFQGGCGERNYSSRGQTTQDIYECCPPTPVELRCSVCYTAERDGCNLWTCVPFVSYSVLCGPTLADLLVHLLNLLPMSLLACLGIAHPRCCSAKPKPPRLNCNPERTPQRCAPRCPPVNRCAPGGDISASKQNTKKPCPCPPGTFNRMSFDKGDGSYGTDDRLMKWMHDEYEALARELADITRLTNEDEGGGGVESNRDLAYARNYVLDRLAEMLAKKEEIEKRQQLKMQNRMN